MFYWIAVTISTGLSIFCFILAYIEKDLAFLYFVGGVFALPFLHAVITLFSNYLARRSPRFAAWLDKRKPPEKPPNFNPFANKGLGCFILILVFIGAYALQRISGNALLIIKLFFAGIFLLTLVFSVIVRISGFMARHWPAYADWQRKRNAVDHSQSYAPYDDEEGYPSIEPSNDFGLGCLVIVAFFIVILLIYFYFIFSE